MIFQIVKTELLAIFRDRRSLILVVALGVLLFFAAWGGSGVSQVSKNAHEAAMKKANEQFVNQKTGDPFMAGDYGHFVFKPGGPLSGLDSGIENQTGKILKLQANGYNLRVHNSAATVGSMMRFGQLETGFVVQIILPLVLVLLGFGAVASERESGLLRLSLLQGVKPFNIVVGKALAIWLIGAFLFAALVGIGALRIPGVMTSEVLPRLLIFGVVHLVYIWVVVAVTVACSAFVSSARTCLSILLVIWCSCAAVFPPLTAYAMHRLQPLPESGEVMEAVWDMESKYDAYERNSPWKRKLIDDALAEHGVSSLKDLPFDFHGVVMDFVEEKKNGAYLVEMEKLNQKFERQTLINSAIALVNPLQAIDAVSMSLAGSDLFHDLDFDAQATAYRTRMIKKLNEIYYAKAHVHADGTSHSHGINKDFLETLGDFEYQVPPLSFSFSSRWGEWLVLLFWFGLATTLLVFSARGLPRRSIS